MKLHLLSDLHIEFGHFNYPETDCDVVILAGDIHTKAQGIQWAMDAIPDKPVIYVMGNHEYYGKTYPKLLDELKSLTEGTNVHLLENDTITLDGINFFGCTLWTDFSLFGPPEIAGYHAQQRMNDYKKIKRLPNYSKMRSIDTAVIHKRSLDWLKRQLEQYKSDTNVVVTHHGPSMKSVPDYYQEDLLTAAYVSNLESLISEYQPVAWLHGHLHNNSDYHIGNCRVVCNPKGYKGEENDQFEPQKTITI